MSTKIKRSTFLPIILLVYLGVMAYIGRGELAAGNYLYYFGIIGITLVCIVLLHFFLRKREKLRDEREAENRKSSKRNGNI
ncbi:MAG: hypothetical protein HDR92_04905 [Bacteroides sp.]|nr:hypothetical protein [Bacteroides sp.]